MLAEHDLRGKFSIGVLILFVDKILRIFVGFGGIFGCGLCF